MIDFHTHSIFSDGVLIPAELIQRAIARGYKGIAITDHIDQANVDLVVPRVVKAVRALRDYVDIVVLAGAEITHVPPRLIPEIVKECRSLGAQIVLVHGETIVEPVPEGTNTAAIDAGADILAHPGIISDDDVKYAVQKGVILEITARAGHSLSNGLVAKKALHYGAKMVINTDSHSPSDLITKDFATKVLQSAGLDEVTIEGVFDTANKLLQKGLKRA